MTQSMNTNPYYHNYYQPGPCIPGSGVNVRPFPPDPGLQAFPAPPWDKSIAEHNAEKTAHPHILALVKSMATSSGNYYCVDTIAARDSLEEEKRVVGTLAYVLETDSMYQLIGGIENENWRSLNINSEKYIKLGRINPPINPEDGTIYVDLVSERIMVYFGSWMEIPNKKDVENAIQTHNADDAAHAEKFAEVENTWLSI